MLIIRGYRSRCSCVEFQNLDKLDIVQSPKSIINNWHFPTTNHSSSANIKKIEGKRSTLVYYFMNRNSIACELLKVTMVDFEETTRMRILKVLQHPLHSKSISICHRVFQPSNNVSIVEPHATGNRITIGSAFPKSAWRQQVCYKLVAPRYMYNIENKRN